MVGNVLSARISNESRAAFQNIGSPKKRFQKTVSISAASAALATLFGMTAALAAPLPGPRNAPLRPFYEALSVPPSAPQKQAALNGDPSLKKVQAYVEIQASLYEDFYTKFGSSRTPGGASCCGRGDCRAVADLGEEKDGSHWVEIPDGAYPGSNKKIIQVPPNAVIKDTSNLPRPQPLTSTLCASDNLASVYCFHPVGSASGLPIEKVILGAWEGLKRRALVEKSPPLALN